MGVNFFFYYGIIIFCVIGFSDSYVIQIIFGFVNVGCIFGGFYIVKKCGRRNVFMGGVFWMMVCFFVYLFVGCFKFDFVNLVNMFMVGNVFIVFFCLFIVVFVIIWGFFVWVVMVEFYFVKYCVFVMVIVIVSNWFWNFLMSFFICFIIDLIGYLYGFVFVGCCVVFVFIVFFFLVESKDCSLEEIDIMYMFYVNFIISVKWFEDMVFFSFVSDEKQIVYMEKSDK